MAKFEEDQRRRDIQYRAFMVRSRATFKPGTAIDWGVIELQRQIERREDEDRRARLSPADQALLDFARQVLFMIVSGPVGEFAGGLVVSRAAGGGVRIAHGARAVEFSQAELAALRVNAFRSGVDLLRARLGPARISHPDEYARIIKHLEEEGVEIVWGTEGRLPYDAVKGSPGRILLREDLSIGALRHEYRHFLDTEAAGFPGKGPYMEDL